MNRLHRLQGFAILGQGLNTLGVVCALTFGALLVLSETAHASNERSWQFDVLLDGKPIGEHEFTVTSNGEQATIKSNARFDVEVLFFNAYSYRHKNTEVWRGDCLQSIDAVTRVNGERSVVEGQQAEAGFQLGSKQLEGCVSTFAYWDPEFLQRDKLLNPQTGESKAVEVTSLGLESFQLKDEALQAKKYRVVVDNSPIEVWYSEDGLWLGLTSEAKGGREIRYVAKRLPRDPV